MQIWIWNIKSHLLPVGTAEGVPTSKQGFTCFIDYEKIFDRIKHTKLIAEQESIENISKLKEIDRYWTADDLLSLAKDRDELFQVVANMI